jgi:hypothetical protein
MRPVYLSGPFEALAKIFVNEMARGRGVKTPTARNIQLELFCPLSDLAEIWQACRRSKKKILIDSFCSIFAPLFSNFRFCEKIWSGL